MSLINAERKLFIQKHVCFFVSLQNGLHDEVTLEMRLQKLDSG